MPTHRHLLASCAVLAGVLAANPLHAESPAASGTYAPTIDPRDFAAAVTNKYFTLKPGARFIFKNKSGSERIEVAVTDERKQVMGVTATVVRVKEWKKDTLVEETSDWYAQDNSGTVWYFGEAVDNYKDGKLADHKGSWEAGIDGAMPGIIMLGNPKVGETYRQEYYKGHAEDMGTIVALDASVSVPFGTFERCLQIKDWSRIEQGTEYKYYCPAVGFLTVEQSVGGGDKLELVKVEADR